MMENVLDVGQIIFLKLVRIIDVVIAALDVHGTNPNPVCIEGEHLTLPETCFKIGAVHKTENKGWAPRTVQTEIMITEFF